MKKYCVSFDDIKTAESVLKTVVHHTPMVTCSAIDALASRNLYLKCENFQKTGSFKFRGGYYAVQQAACGDQSTKPNCFVTYSSGNLGQAIAKAAQMFQVPAYIVMPKNSMQNKKSAVKGYGANIVDCGLSDKEAYEVVDKVCLEKNGCEISANLCPAMFAGQGTMALEMLEQNPDLDIIVAPVSTGSMISGIAIAAKHLKPSIRIYAAEPEQADDCYLSKINGKIIPLTQQPTTIADGARTTICQSAWPIIRDLVDDVITVSEDEIKQATKLVWERAKLVIEPTSGVGVAAVMSKKFSTARNNKDDLKNVGVVLCGGNMNLSVIAHAFNSI